jgi:hypothetical protein
MYHGWKNRETWQVKASLEDGEPDYELWQCELREILAVESDMPAAVYALSLRLQAEIEGDGVDWNAVARAMIEEYLRAMQLRL